MVVNEDFAILDDRLAYSSQEKAEEMAKNIGCEGFHIHMNMKVKNGICLVKSMK